MTRVAISDGGWFDSAKTIRFDEATWWDGHNHISAATGSQWEHEALFHTRSGAWVLHRSSQWQGSGESYECIDAEDAARWLVKNEHTDLAELPEPARKEVEGLIASMEV